MDWKKMVRLCVLFLALACICWPTSCGVVQDKIGVIFVVYGGMSEYGHLGYDAALGAPDPDSPV